ncbi:AsnC family transcriptional regulator [Allosaccharopolyspora coralli]|uniref:AsnC family transcriptional regulator n=1 Tax=Allosaccharopolyspora coralli TaxID=2665642 RepID=A0A5Q3QDD2_9PSEU|nr:Lrp/AsnC family transcriptional regulator [Allosaccharopolyspora coralli]QGK69569.1 AsnC family transcriptional regulator [Allosaccharopolyspora coralli]
MPTTPTGSATSVLDELDRAVIHALQIAPRASWTDLGAALQYSGTTLARRWNRLRSQGWAWVTGSGSPKLWFGMAGALLRADVAEEAVDEVLSLLARDPRTKSVYRLAGRGSVLAHVIVTDRSHLDTWSREIASLQGVLDTDVRMVTGTHQDARTWRLDGLTPAQQKELHVATGTSRPIHLPPERVRPLLHALGRDGRASAAELARSTGWPRTTVQRRLLDLSRAGLLAIRCDVTQEAVGCPVTLWLSGSLDAAVLSESLPRIAALSQVRLLLTTTGVDNVVIGAWLGRVEDALDLERRLVEAAPQLRVREREVAMRKAKIQGWIVDDTGRARESVPIDPWAQAGPGR